MIPRRLVESVKVLTHKDDGLSYMQYIERVKKDPLARRVKIVDLEHNMDMSRYSCEPTEQMMSRLRRYEKALDFLLTED